MRTSLSTSGGTSSRLRSVSVVGCLMLSLLLSACGGRGIVKDDSAVVSPAAMSRANATNHEMMRFIEITRKISIASVDLCEYKMPQLDFIAHAMPTEGMSEPDVQAMIRTAKTDANTRVLVSANRTMKPLSVVEKVGSQEIGPSKPGWEFQRAITSEAVGKDSVDIQISGVTYRYGSKPMCAAVPLYRLENEPKAMNMTYASERFIVALGRNPKPQAGERSDNEIAFISAMQIAAAAGGKLDSAMNARTAFLFASIFPVMPLVNAVIGRPVMNAMIDQKEIDALAFQMLEKSGFDAKAGVASYLMRCGDACRKSWSAERQNRWKSGMRDAGVVTAEARSSGGA